MVIVNIAGGMGSMELSWPLGDCELSTPIYKRRLCVPNFGYGCMQNVSEQVGLCMSELKPFRPISLL